MVFAQIQNLCIQKEENKSFEFQQKEQPALQSGKQKHRARVRERGWPVIGF